MFRISKNSVTFKIFFLTSGLLVVTALVLYAVVYLLLPSYYERYKVEELNKGLTKLVEKAPTKKWQEYLSEMDRFTQEYNAKIILSDFTGKPYYIPFYFIHAYENGEATYDNTPIHPSTANDVEMYKYQSSDGTPSIYTFSNPIFFANGAFIINGNVTLQPIEEASNVLRKFLPYMAFVFLLLALITGYVYSKLIAKPLLQVNQIAKQMAQLDFTAMSTVESDDEIGQLSTSLNELSGNLQIAMAKLKFANEQLLEDLEKERKVEEKRREFVATVSHELKSPITAVKGQLEGMIHGIGVYKNTDKYLKRSYGIMEEMEGLVKDMLEISRLESPAFAPNIQKLNLSAHIEKMVGKIDYFLREKNMTLELNVLHDIYIDSDENLLSKVLHNVLYNAVNYSGENETIKVTLEDDIDQYCLSVLNTGVFIEEKDIGDLFRPFYRLEKSRNRNTGGSGLGLYIVKTLLESLGHPFSMTSTEEGVLFVICFEKSG